MTAAQTIRARTLDRQAPLRDPASLRWAVALVALTGVRLLMAAVVPLAPDETYYWVWSHALAPGYLDHPPMVALWIRAGTWVAGETPFGIRLMGPVSAALGSVLLVDAAERLRPGSRAGFMAAALLNATLLFGVGTVIITPDTPLLFFWTGSLWAAARLSESARTRWWLALGLLAGLAMASKYTALLLWAGLGIWVLVVPRLRAELRRPGPWLAGAAALVVFAPVVAWNAMHAWASFLRQGGRTGDWHPARAVTFLAELAGSQIGLATPLIFLLCVAGVVAASRLAWKRRDPSATLLAALTVPGVLLFLQHAIGDRVQGNWPAILYPAACIAATGVAAASWRRLWWPAVSLGLVCTGFVYLDASTELLPIPPERDPIALRLSGWSALARQVEATRAATGATYVAADQYAAASELAYLMPAGVPVLGVEDRWALTVLPRETPPDGPGLLIRGAGWPGPIEPGRWSQAMLVGEVGRGPVERFRLYWVTAAPGSGSFTRLPRPTPQD